MNFPKSVRIKFTPKQVKQLAELFDYAEEQYYNNKPGVVFGQPENIHFLYSRITMNIKFIENRYAKKLAELIDEAREKNKMTGW